MAYSLKLKNDIKHLEKYENCTQCIHIKACEAWANHGVTLYDDFSYSVNNCPHFHVAEENEK